MTRTFYIMFLSYIYEYLKYGYYQYDKNQQKKKFTTSF